MKRLLAVMCCLALAGCAASSASEWSDAGPLVGGPAYAQHMEEASALPPEQPGPSTCTIKNGTATCF